MNKYYMAKMTNLDQTLLQLADLVPSSPTKEPLRPKRYFSLDPNVFSYSDVEVGEVPGRRAKSSPTASA